MRKGFLTHDIEFNNKRVVGSNLLLPSYEELNGNDITHACSTNAERNLIKDNNFAKYFENTPSKKGDSFSILLQTMITKGNFIELKTGKPKSSKYHKMIFNKRGDDKATFRGKQSVTRVDPCLKLYVGCPIMVSANDHNKGKIVKGTTRIFKDVALKADKSLKEELWSDHKVYAIEANDVDYIVCEQPNKDKNKQSKSSINLPNPLVLLLNMKCRKNALSTYQNQNSLSSLY